MKITKQKLKKIIKEELRKVLGYKDESDPPNVTYDLSGEKVGEGKMLGKLLRLTGEDEPEKYVAYLAHYIFLKNVSVDDYDVGDPRSDEVWDGVLIDLEKLEPVKGTDFQENYLFKLQDPPMGAMEPDPDDIDEAVKLLKRAIPPKSESDYRSRSKAWTPVKHDYNVG